MVEVVPSRLSGLDAVPVLSADLIDSVVAWRRDLHRNPELGFREFRTACFVAALLDELGFILHLGEEAMDARAILDYPRDLIAERYALARSGEDYAKFLPRMEGGLTAVVADLDTGRPGPTLAFRFEMDALPIQEDQREAHLPRAEGFASSIDGRMHACGHDGHVAMGLGLASTLVQLRDSLTGRVRLIFQPAEEGAPGGAAAIVARGWVDDIDYFVACHLGLGVPTGNIVARAKLLATTKYRVVFSGQDAHVTNTPQDGRNALLAAARAALSLHSIAPHGSGWFSLNVGVLRAGEEQGVTPSSARMELGLWADTSEVHNYVKARVTEILDGIAAGSGVTLEIQHIGEAPAVPQDAYLAGVAREAALSVPTIREITDELDCRAADDAEKYLQRVGEKGGKGIYMIIGSDLRSGHHSSAFDFDEASLPLGTTLLRNIAILLLRSAQRPPSSGNG